MKKLQIRLKVAILYVNMAIFTLPALFVSHLYMQKLSALAAGEGDGIVKAFAFGYPIFMLIYIAVTIFIGRKLTGVLAFPLQDLMKAAKRIAVGDVEVNLDYSSPDEIGALYEAVREVRSAIRSQVEVLSVAASGDLTVQVPIRSEQDIMNTAINSLIEKNHQSMREIQVSSSQVKSGATQIATAAQSLATGTSEQAATIEELTATATQIQQMTDENTKEAEIALSDNKQVGALMGESMESMRQMLLAMQEIDHKSQNITRVIKVIDDIAFQTNILALNAAVEAARAGQHGKGFAVVADEVRNLASKSAEAAKETSDLVSQSARSVAEGNAIVGRVSGSLEAVAEIAGKNANSIEKMNAASRRQSSSMAALVVGAGEIATVVQANAATAQQTAASAEEMSAQSELLNQIVHRYRLGSEAGNLQPQAQAFRSEGMSLEALDGSKY